MYKKRAIIAGLLTTLLTGCASLSSVSMTQVPAKRQKPIEAEATSWGFLGTFFSNSFADEVVESLRSQCPNGKVTGVYTKHENRFYIVMVQRKVSAQAFCESAPKNGV